MPSRCPLFSGNPLFSGGGEGGRIQEFAWDGEVLWDFLWSDEDHLQHHDIEPLPGGNVLLISWERRSREEAIAAAIEGLCAGDVLVVAGKGHEEGQTIGDEVRPFDDGAVIRAALGGALQALWVARRAAGEDVSVAAVVAPFVAPAGDPVEPDPDGVDRYREVAARFRAAVARLWDA